MKVTLIPTESKLQSFGWFKDGDVLVAEETRVVGIKIDSRTILFLNSQPNGDPGLCHDVDPFRQYLVPTLAELTVTL